jgi:pimeloyl-ACP methyl ester carboxylesterase
LAAWPSAWSSADGRGGGDSAENAALMSVVATTKELLAGSVPLTYLDIGAGAPILVLHGAGGLPPDAAFLELLAAHGRVIAPTHPGYGRSVLPEWIDSVDDLAYVYLDLLDALDLRDVTVVGFSMGGWIAAEIAVKSTARIARIVLVDAVGIKISDRLTRDIVDMFAMDPGELNRISYHDVSKALNVNGLSDEALEIVARNREAAALYLWEPYAHNPKLTRRLHRIDVPVLVLWGESDGFVKPSYGRAYAELIPGARFETIPAAGHAPQYEQPEDFVNRVVRFLGER